MAGRKINESRQLALITGERTYVGAEHKCGTTERYVKGGGCVHCARQLQTEARSARLAMIEGNTPIVTKPKPAPKPAEDVLSVVARRVAASASAVKHAAPEDLSTDPAAATSAESYPNPWD